MASLSGAATAGASGRGIWSCAFLRLIRRFDEFGLGWQRQAHQIIEGVCHVGDLVFDRSERMPRFGNLGLAFEDLHLERNSAFGGVARLLQARLSGLKAQLGCVLALLGGQSP